MLLRLIEAFKAFGKKSYSEEKYIEDIVFIQKECWLYHMNQEDIFKHTTKYLNKVILEPDRHPFLSNFKEQSNNLLNKDTFDKEEANK